MPEPRTVRMLNPTLILKFRADGDLHDTIVESLRALASDIEDGITQHDLTAGVNLVDWFGRYEGEIVDGRLSDEEQKKLDVAEKFLACC